MSVKKIETVQKSRKDQGKCSKCGVELPAGSGYLCWYPHFRSNYKIVRCLKKECFPRPSERESSLAVTALAAQENFEDVADDICSVDEAEEAVHDVGEGFRSVAEEYQNALDAWEYGNEQLQEKVDHYEAQADELENWSYDGPDEQERCDLYESDEHEDDCGECEELLDTWLSELRDAARDAVQSAETM